MNAFFIAQGIGLDLTIQIIEAMQSKKSLKNIGMYIADEKLYKKYKSKINHYQSIYEWEIIKESLEKSQYSKNLFTGELPNISSNWEQIICDRRLIHGSLSKYYMNYSSDFKLNELISIITITENKFFEIFNKIKPEFIFSLGPSIHGARIAYAISRTLKIPFLTLKSTKINNILTLGDRDDSIYNHINDKYEEYLSQQNIPPSTLSYSKKYLFKATNNKATYEGNKITKYKKNNILKEFLFFSLQFPKAFIKELIRNKYDLQYSNHIYSLFHRSIGKSIRIEESNNYINARIIEIDQLKNLKFAFFALNSEPEIAVDVYSYENRNQIFLAHKIAQSLPLEKILIVKEHPRSEGVRNPSFYKDLLSMPNIFISKGSVSQLVKLAEFNIVLSGFAAFESLFARKPVITFGNHLLNIIGPPLVWKLTPGNSLKHNIKKIISSNISDDDFNTKLIYIISAIKSTGIEFNLYSDFFHKLDRDKFKIQNKETIKKQLNGLIEYLIERISQVKKEM